MNEGPFWSNWNRGLVHFLCISFWMGFWTYKCANVNRKYSRLLSELERKAAVAHGRWGNYYSGRRSVAQKRLGTPDLGYMFWQLTEEKSKSQHFTRVFSEQIYQTSFYSDDSNVPILFKQLQHFVSLGLVQQMETQSQRCCGLDSCTHDDHWPSPQGG